MSATYWIFFALIALAVPGLSLWYYHRFETPGRGRILLALLRATALLLIVLLLFDPQVGSANAGTGATEPYVLLDASASMALPAGADGSSRWSAGVEAAREGNAGERLLLFGARPRRTVAAQLDTVPPGDVDSRLLPALQAVAEAGGHRVVVITDGELADAEEVKRWLPRLGLDVEVRRVGTDLPNRGLAEVVAPAWAPPGEPVDVQFGVRSTGVGDSIRVALRQEGRIVGTATVPAAAAGRLATGTIRFQPETRPDAALLRYDLALDAGDAVPADDSRSVYVLVGADPAGVALVSLQPDWEPRFLAPVLERALGLPLRAFLRAADGRWIRLATGLDAGGAAPESDVRAAAERAELLVFHGAGAAAPDWVRERIATAPRLLIFPTRDAAVLDLPVQLGGVALGDFYPVGDLPPSPVAPALTGIDAATAAPLTSLHTVVPPAGTWAPLLVTRGRQGPRNPAVVAGSADGRRWAVALGDGYWRWSLRGGADRDLYARLWGALAGWLMREPGAGAAAAVRPTSHSIPQGEPVSWMVPPADSVRLRLTADDGRVVQDTVIATAGADTVRAPALQPGHYRYDAQPYGRTATAGAGPLTIETFSPELHRPVIADGALDAAGTVLRTGPRRAGRPLHTYALPYLLVLLLLAGEWILRRRWGLR